MNEFTKYAIWNNNEHAAFFQQETTQRLAVYQQQFAALTPVKQLESDALNVLYAQYQNAFNLAFLLLAESKEGVVEEKLLPLEKLKTYLMGFQQFISTCLEQYQGKDNLEISLLNTQDALFPWLYKSMLSCWNINSYPYIATLLNNTAWLLCALTYHQCDSQVVEDKKSVCIIQQNHWIDFSGWLQQRCVHSKSTIPEAEEALNMLTSWQENISSKIAVTGCDNHSDLQTGGFKP